MLRIRKLQSRIKLIRAFDLSESCLHMNTTKIHCIAVVMHDIVCCSLGPRPKPTPAWSTGILEAIRTGVGLGLGPRLCLL